MTNLLEQPNIVKEILQQLSEVDSIPNEGFLAGGAVANTLLKMKYNNAAYPINDLDIFIESKEDGPERLVSTPLRTNNLVIENGYYEGNIAYDHGSNYRILEVSREGLLNWITISRVNDRENVKNYQYILRGFDFNCCQVGIDLNNNKLYYTEEFVEFLNTKQLEVTAIYTPAHTAIRLFKKIKELKCYCNVEKCMELLSTPLIPQIQCRLRRTHFGLYFGEKYKEMFIRYYGELKPYFRMVKFFDHKKLMWKERYEQNHIFESIVDPLHPTNWLDPNRSIPQDLLDKWAEYNDIMWTLTPQKYVYPHKEIEEILDGVGYNPLTFMSSYKLINGKMKKTLTTKAKLVIENGRYTKIIALINSNFYDCDFTISHIKEVDKNIDEAKHLTRYILKYNLNLQESVSFCKDIVRIIKKEGEWILPILTTTLEEGNTTIKPTFENMCKWIENKRKEMDKPLISPLSLTHLNFPDHITVKELVSECDLSWAGMKLKNCLNNPGQGYANKISSGDIKVFVIMSTHSTSALELHKTEEGLVFKEKQLLSSCNKKPSLHHRIVADILKNELNIDILKNSYEERIKRYQDIIFLNKGLLATTPDKSTKLNEVMYNFGEERDPEEVIFDVDFEEEGIGLRPIRGRRGRIIGEELRAPEPQTLGDLDALRELREQLDERRGNVGIGNTLSEDHTIEVEDEDLDILD